MLLAGCGGPEEAVDTPEEETMGDAAAPVETDPAEAGDDMAEDDPDGITDNAADDETDDTADDTTDDTTAGETPDDTAEDPASEELQELLLRTGLAESESIGISGDDATQIKGAVAGMMAAYIAGPGGKDKLVNERDWSVYGSNLSKENLSRRETEFYNRLNKMCLKYLTLPVEENEFYVAPPQNIQISEADAGSTWFSSTTDVTQRSVTISWDLMEGVPTSLYSYEYMLFTDAEYTTPASSSINYASSGRIIHKSNPETTYYFGVRASRIINARKYYSDWVYFSHTTGKIGDEKSQRLIED